MLTVALVDRLIAEQEAVCNKIEASIEGLPEDRAVVNLALSGVQASLALEKLKEARRLMDETGILFGAV